MNASRLSIKFDLKAGSQPDHAALVRLFHEFIRERRLDDVLIDVADYGHVPEGPHVLLVGDGGNYALDYSEGKPGFFYQRKRPIEGDFATRLRETLVKTLGAAHAVQTSASIRTGLALDTTGFRLRIHDRLEAPNTLKTWDAIRDAANRVSAQLYPGATVDSKVRPDTTEPFTAWYRAVLNDPPQVEELLARLR